MLKFSEFSKEVHKTATEKGWWEGVDLKNVDSIAARICLIHSEVSEALEEVRIGELDLYWKDGKPEGMIVELADAVIRCMDLSEALGLDLEQAILTKTEFNKTRTHRHGGKKL